MTREGTGTWGDGAGEERVLAVTCAWPGSDFLALCHSPAQLCLIFDFFQKFQKCNTACRATVMELDLKCAGAGLWS